MMRLEIRHKWLRRILDLIQFYEKNLHTRERMTVALSEAIRRDEYYTNKDTRCPHCRGEL